MAANLGTFLSDVGDVLHELAIDEGTIKSILASLEAGATELPGEKQLRPIPPGAFSALPAGTQMGFHTNNAQTYLLDVMTEMMQILGLYRDGVTAYQAGSTTTDEFSADELNRIHKVVNQANKLNTGDLPGGGQS